MKTINNVRRKELIKSKMRPGDLLTASEMLNITSDAARMRLNRGKEDMLYVMEKIFENRKILINEYQNSLIDKI
ncbi:hypothetical protein ETU08_01930 [Apibacter muscae]|uniref:DNA-binding protein n=1 Tax=Apibacter muscae TaxID=2509004 RepID=A0A563DL62_9FLAO|nr:hypothetical protein [Apibacter muscae]TWP30544.1 hypothetical protein ETU09_00655 [Apibacter muscae]TWP31264.1 hypothetical protein ETU08_01930 [Apibacter muscae]